MLASVDGGFLEDVPIIVEFFKLGEDADDAKYTVAAEYSEIQGVTPHLHEDGLVHKHLDSRGFHVIRKVIFNAPGTWIARFAANDTNGQRLSVEDAAFTVLEVPETPAIGDPIPSTQNLTIHDVDDVTEIDSHVPPDNMHTMTIAQALNERSPFVIVWSSPSFCGSRTCGPVTDVVIDAQRQYHDRVNFIHIEPWDLKIARLEGRLVPIPEVGEWGLPSEPWVFIVGHDGLVVERFEGMVSLEELQEAINKSLKQPGR